MEDNDNKDLKLWDHITIRDRYWDLKHCNVIIADKDEEKKEVQSFFVGSRNRG